MQLQDDEQALLEGKHGPTLAKAMQILLAIGQIYGARRFLSVHSVQVAGVSYQNLGEAGLDFIREWSQDARSCTLATLNPAGMDMQNWQSQGITPAFAAKQQQVVAAYKQMGIIPSCTCTPYLAGQFPSHGEHIAWSESSAVCFANSVLGALTNREGGPAALASALTGKTPEYGLHLSENRQAQCYVRVEAAIQGTAAFSALGYAIGQAVGPCVPYVHGIERASLEELKSFCAAIATSGGVALFYMQCLPHPPIKCQKQVRIGPEQLAAVRTDFADECEPQLVALGCPHLSLREIQQAAWYLQGRRVQRELWLCTSRAVKLSADAAGYTAIITKAGGQLVCDTCPAVAPLKERFSSMATDSAKACYYARGTNQFKVQLLNFEDCLNLALQA